MTIVTKDSLQTMLDSDNKTFVMHVVGRALVVLFKNQTANEQTANTVSVDNGVGFTHADGRSGCISAKTYIGKKHLQDWQVEMWTKKNDKGYSRIAKYWSQLNTAAEQKKGQAA